MPKVGKCRACKGEGLIIQSGHYVICPKCKGRGRSSHLFPKFKRKNRGK